ncbi:DUF3375 domain-containing protein [Nocardioidaceae bacterium]|nr:DUF3375 domain-containing protein [Nocardioidaceae bacterium]
MDFEAIERLRDRHAGWRLLRAQHAPLILAFLGEVFVDGNSGAVPASHLMARLDDHLHALNTREPAGDTAEHEPPFPREARAYLEEWSSTDSGYLRRFYPRGDGEVHYEVTPAFEKAYAWVDSLAERRFVGTESRLHTAVELLRQIVQGTESDPQARLAELHRQRAAIDAEIARVEAGEVVLLEGSGVRDRYQQFATLARELLADFREVEDNFRRLDRDARERIATWAGSKGELLADLVGGRSQITASDQGRSFTAFYEFLLSDTRQRELADLLDRVGHLDEVEVDRRTRGIHHDWSEAAERTQRTVRQISEQLRRFLDDQVWLENRRVLELVRSIETSALTLRAGRPAAGLWIDEPGVPIALPLERPLHTPARTVEVESTVLADAELDAPDLLFTADVVDAGRLAENIRAVLPSGSSARLDDILELYPLEHGAAELIGYLALDEPGMEVEVDPDGSHGSPDGSPLDHRQEMVVEYDDTEGVRRRATLPAVTVRRA